MPLIDSGDAPTTTDHGQMFVAHDSSTLEPVFVEVQTWVLHHYGQAPDLDGINRDVRSAMLASASAFYDASQKSRSHIMLSAETLDLS